MLGLGNHQNVFKSLIFFTILLFCEAQIETRIVNGLDAIKSEFPWIINMVNSPLSDHRCGGVIINQNWVLTAGHCVTDITPSSIQLIAGDHNRIEPDNAKQRRGVNEWILHPNYDPNSKTKVTHDFALLRVSTPFEFTNSVRKVILPSNSSVIGNGKMTMAGWGYTDPQNHVVPEILQKADLTIIPSQECRLLYSFLEFTNEMFCGGDPNSSACSGDSGSGLVEIIKDPITNCKTHVLFGIVSFGKGECDGGLEFPTIFGDVPAIVDWILETTGEQDTSSSTDPTTCGIDTKKAKENDEKNGKDILSVNFGLILSVLGLSIRRCLKYIF